MGHSLFQTGVGGSKKVLEDLPGCRESRFCPRLSRMGHSLFQTGRAKKDTRGRYANVGVRGSNVRAAAYRTEHRMGVRDEKALPCYDHLCCALGGFRRGPRTGTRGRLTRLLRRPRPSTPRLGMYLGANLGYGWGDARYDAALNASALGFIPGLPGTAVAGTAISASEKIDGVIGGVQTGYNYQFGAWVWGLETDFQGSGQKGGSTFARTFATVIGPIPVSVTTDHKLEWFGTTRGRLGFLWSPNVLVYGTAGVAYGQVRDSATLNASALGGAVTAAANATFKDVKAGWTAGAGIEGALWGAAGAPSSNISTSTSARPSRRPRPPPPPTSPSWASPAWARSFRLTLTSHSGPPTTSSGSV